ncbi:MAG: hypothetical protein PVG01_06735, partial [Desulfobacterales bacterium]
MNFRKLSFLGVIVTTLLVALAALGFAQEVTGPLGSPAATTTIDGHQLPPPAPPFGGEIKESALESK